MKNTLTEGQFVSALLADQYASWSRAQAEALFGYYEQLEDDLGTEIEFDVVAIRCEWSRYDTIIEAADDYGQEDEDEDTAMKWLRDRTIVIKCKDGSVLVMEF